MANCLTKFPNFLDMDPQDQLNLIQRVRRSRFVAKKRSKEKQLTKREIEEALLMDAEDDEELDNEFAEVE